jgi:hypothetical protein
MSCHELIVYHLKYVLSWINSISFKICPVLNKWYIIKNMSCHELIVYYLKYVLVWINSISFKIKYIHVEYIKRVDKTKVFFNWLRRKYMYTILLHKISQRSFYHYNVCVFCMTFEININHNTKCICMYLKLQKNTCTITTRRIRVNFFKIHIHKLNRSCWIVRDH